MDRQLLSATRFKVFAWAIVALVYIYFQIATLPRTFVETFPDSERYFSPTSIFSVENAGIFYSLFVRAFDVFPGIILSQVLLSMGSWILLSYGVLRLFSAWVGLLLSIATLCIASQESVTNWNNLILSESVSISLMALWLASLLLVVKPAISQKLIQFLLCFFLLTSLLLLLSRPQAILFVIPVGIVILFANKSNINRTMKWIFGGGIGLLAVAAVARLFQIAQGSPFAQAYSQHLLEYRPGFSQFGLTQANCDPVSASTGIPYSELISYCPNLETIVQEKSLSFSSWVMHSPLDALAAFKEWFITQAILVNYSSAPTIVERDLANKVMAVGYPFTSILVYYTLFACVVVAICAVIYRLRFSVRRLFVAAMFVALLLAYVFLTWGVDGIEMPRHTLPILLFIPPVVAGAFFYVFGLDKPLIKRK